MSSKFWDNYSLVVEGMLQALPAGFTFYLSDLEKVVFKAPVDAVTGVKVGEPYVPHGPSGTAIRTEQVVNMELDISYYGEPIRVFAAPIYDEEEPELLLGAFAISLSRDNAFALRNLVNTHQVGMSEIGMALKRMSMDSHDIKINNAALYQRIKNVQESLERICAEQPLNEDIVARVDEMKADLGRAITESQTIVQRSEEQASLTQIISNRVKELAEMIEELNRIAHEI